MVNTNLADLLAFLRHVNDEAINDAARAAGLVIDRLDCRGDDLEVVVCLEGLVHLRLDPQLFEQSCYDAEVGRNLREHLVGRAVTNGDGEKSIRSHNGTSCHGLSP